MSSAVQITRTVTDTDDRPARPRRLLVIESDSRTDESVRQTLLSHGAFSCHFVNADEFDTANIASCTDDLAVISVASRPALLLEMLRSLTGSAATTPVLAILPANSESDVLQAASQSADDFVLLPCAPAELRQRIDRLLAQPQHELGAVRRHLAEELGISNLIGRDPVFLHAVSQLPRFARAELPVCVTGETGTGKELCARALHHLSRRQRFPFIAIDCGALPDQLFENELFGHLRGAFTDAHRDHKGLVAMAAGGTLFLDEVDSLSLAAQAKLLRFLQERSYRPLGSDRFESADVRVITATNRDIEASVREKQFRSDLYFRVNVLRLRLPPLRQRRGDIELLACAALKDCASRAAGGPTGFSAAALRRLSAHDWPGNVRELYNVVQRAVVACDGERVLPEHIDLPTLAEEAQLAKGDFRSERAAAMAGFERRFVEDLLRKHNGNVTQAAREARQDRRAFGRFVKKYNIDRRSMTA